MGRGGNLAVRGKRRRVVYFAWRTRGGAAARTAGSQAHSRHGTQAHTGPAHPRPPPPPTTPDMGDKSKHNGEAEGNPKDEDVGAEGDETTDDEGGVDTPPPQKEEDEDAAAEDGTFEVGVASCHWEGGAV